MAQDEDLELLRTSLPPEQPHEREQVPNDEIDERPEQAALPRPRPRTSNLAEPDDSESRGRVCEPYALRAFVSAKRSKRGWREITDLDRLVLDLLARHQDCDCGRVSRK